MNAANARVTVAEDLLFYHSIVMRLRTGSYEYRQLRRHFDDHKALLTQLQRMLEAGDITATDLKHGLITDRSLITLA
jgi:hypothetical protein